MAGSEYSSVVGGGLKLKGAKPTGIAKKKRKKDKEKSGDVGGSASKTQAVEDVLGGAGRDAVDAGIEEQERYEGGKGGKEKERDRDEDEGDEGVEYGERDGKTEAERQWEERKRRRLDERLRKEGVKTHKQRVEELNKYLSNLSEHHDMPRIGPG